MTWNSASSTLRGRLARHLGRLQQNLDAVGEQVREAIANAVGRSVAEAVGEAVYEALSACDGPHHPLSHAAYAGREAIRPRAWDEPGWERDVARSNWRDSYDDDDSDDPRYGDDRGPISSPRDETRAGRWGRAVAAGLQAAAWWLRRHPGRLSLLAALAVGAVAGLTVLAGHVSGIAGVVTSALGLIYLLDLMRSVGALFGHDLTP
jgi:hypothetical protein